MNWNRFSLFKMPKKYNRFEFKPRYYDERKEALEKKIKAYSKESEGDTSKVRREINFRENAGDRWGNGDYRSKSMKANIRLLVILGVVLFGFYILYTQIDFSNLSQGSN